MFLSARPFAQFVAMTLKKRKWKFVHKKTRSIKKSHKLSARSHFKKSQNKHVYTTYFLLLEIHLKLLNMRWEFNSFHKILKWIGKSICFVAPFVRLS